MSPAEERARVVQPGALRAPTRLVAALLVPAMLSGCYTTSNVVTVPAVQTKRPVSASGQYIDDQGNIVKEEEYEIVHSFTLDRRVEVPRHETAETTLDLTTEFDELLATHQGDAMTDVTISATEYDTGSHGSAASWKVLGWGFGLTGATFAITGLAIDDRDTGVGDMFVTMGLVFIGLGAVSYLASTGANDPAAWQLHVEGNVVKRKAPPVPVAPAAPEPAPAAEEGAAPEGARYVPLPAEPGVLRPAPGYRPVRVSLASP